MKDVLKKNMLKRTWVMITIIFLVFLLVNIVRYNIILGHLNSVNDKSPEQRTDIENINALDRSLQKDPNNVNIMFQLTDLYIKTGNKNSAKKLIKKILEIDPSNKEVNERLKQLSNNF